MTSAAIPAAPRITAIGTAVPPCEAHGNYADWADSQIEDRREAKLFRRMITRSGVERRYTVLGDRDAGLEPGSFYSRNVFPGTAERMALYAEAAPKLALEAIRQLPELGQITHIVVASCTGFMAPGLDQLILRELDQRPDVERTVIGFMGCYAGVTALRNAAHLVRSQPDARVLVVALELCTLHMQRTGSIERLLAMGLFADGAAAAIVTGEGPGLALGEGISLALEQSDELMRWSIGDTGFAMHLSGAVPVRLGEALSDEATANGLLQGAAADAIEAWAVHPGGRTIVDAVQASLGVPAERLSHSRDILRDHGNMSSATVLFVLRRMMTERPASGIAMAFGPGLALEGLRFGWTDDAG